MDLQSYICEAFQRWKPEPAEVTSRTQHDVTLCYEDPRLAFLEGELLYTVQRKEKLPPWVTVYSGGKTTKRIDNLAPCTPHKFRVKVTIKAEAIPNLAEKTMQYYKSKQTAFEKLNEGLFKDVQISKFENEACKLKGLSEDSMNMVGAEKDEQGPAKDKDKDIGNAYFVTRPKNRKKKWLDSQYSDELFTSTQAEGSSSPCFCMSVRGGYIEQVQTMLEERPALIHIINPKNGYSPLATAVREGDVTMVRLLLTAGAEVDQRSWTGQTPLHLAALAAHPLVFDALLEKDADFQAVDINDLRVEHYAVDSGDVDMVRHVLAKGGDLLVRDSNGWTPLFRASEFVVYCPHCSYVVVQGASTAMVQELVNSGSEVMICDAAGLSLASAVRLLTNRHGRSRDSIIRLVDSQFPHEKALANFTRLTKKINNVHTLFKI